ncbi:MAG: M24 family metallopeptidase [Actinobacteria bacterium]|nr:M24 family metallopeptidase [Actinomycetota bacterium]
MITSSDLELAEGMVFALEPKFVLPGRGAIGVENTWLVTASGLALITDAPEHIRQVG